MKHQFEANFEEQYINKKNKTATKFVKRKLACNYDPYDQTVITKVKSKKKSKKEYNEQDYNIRNAKWSLFSQSENTHDAHFSYLDKLAHEHDVNLRL